MQFRRKNKLHQHIKSPKWGSVLELKYFDIQYLNTSNISPRKKLLSTFYPAMKINYRSTAAD